jgi:hypothetical protein
LNKALPRHKLELWVTYCGELGFHLVPPVDRVRVTVRYVADYRKWVAGKMTGALREPHLRLARVTGVEVEPPHVVDTLRKRARHRTQFVRLVRALFARESERIHGVALNLHGIKEHVAALDDPDPGPTWLRSAGRVRDGAPALELGACPRCRGDVAADRDHFGPYRRCLQCGWMEDLE